MFGPDSSWLGIIPKPSGPFFYPRRIGGCAIFGIPQGFPFFCECAIQSPTIHRYSLDTPLPPWALGRSMELIGIDKSGTNIQQGNAPQADGPPGPPPWREKHWVHLADHFSGLDLTSPSAKSVTLTDQPEFMPPPERGKRSIRYFFWLFFFTSPLRT